MKDKHTLAVNELKIQAKKQLKKSRQDVLVEESSIHKPLKHYLQAVSVNIGFESWQLASYVLSGKAKVQQSNDFGTLFHHPSCHVLINEWFADYQIAVKSFIGREGRYLLPYKKQFVVAGKDYLAAIGLREKDYVLVDDIQGNWVAGYGTEAWDRLASFIIRRRFE